jgi:hypothetical protein
LTAHFAEKLSVCHLRAAHTRSLPVQAPQVGLLHRVSVLALKLSKHLQTLEICLF